VPIRVILADALEPRINQIRAICEDWARAGLIRESIWIDIKSEIYQVMEMSAEGRRDIAAAEWLAGLPAGRDIQLVVLQPLLEGQEPIELEYIMRKLAPYTLLAQATGHSINLVCPFTESTNVNPAVLHPNRLNIIAIPTDSVAPGAADLAISEHSTMVYSHVAVQLCSAAGLWVGVPEVRRDAVGDMRNIQLQRTFVRYVDASELVDDIVLAVLKEAANPVSRVFNVHGIEYDSLSDSQTQMALELLVKKFVDQNKDSLEISPEKEFPLKDRTAMGLVQAIKMYFEFLFKYLAKAPGRWAKEKVTVITKKVADTANRMIFGDDSAYQIVVNGIAGGGSSSVQVENQSSANSAAEQLLDVSANYLKNETNLFPAPHNPRDVWSDFVQIALGLLDGGTTRSGYPMPQTEGRQQSLVLGTPSKVVPPVSSEAFVLPANIPVTMSGVVIGADDPYLALVAIQQLKDALAKEHSAAVDAELNEQVTLLEHWMAKNTSFAWNVGLIVGTNLNNARLRLRQLGLGVAAKFSETRLAEAELAARRAIWNMLKVSLGIMLGTAALAFTPLLPLVPLLLVGGGVLVVWNIIGGILFHRAIRDYFQVMHQLDEDERKHEHMLSQKIDFARDVQRLAVVYIQYRSWVRLLAETVYHPFGEELVESGVRVSPIRLLTDLTKSLAVGRLATTDGDKDKLLEGVKRKFFQKGWRVDNFNRFLAAMGADPDSVFGDEGVGNNSVLARISALDSPATSRSQMIEVASKKARRLAIEGADYRNWPVLGTGEVTAHHGNTCMRFLSPLLTPVQYLPQDLVNSRDQGDVNTMHPKGASVYMDKRIETNNPENVNVSQLDSNQLTDYQELDFMAIRIERTELFGEPSLAFLAKSQAVLEMESRRAQLVTEQPMDVQG
jgi:hypothetical protein